MIRINLLPQEYRRSERTSPKIFAAILFGIVLVCTAFGWFGMVFFGDLAELEAQNEVLTEQLAQKSKQAGYHDTLQGQRVDFVQRVQTIQDIGKSRRLWTRFVDQVLDVVNNNGDTERHLAWFDGMNVIEQGTQKDVGPRVNLDGGAVQGDSMAKVANLHEDFERAPFAIDMSAKSDPQGKINIDKKKTPQESFQFPMQLEFKPPSAWLKNNTPTAPGR